MARVSEESRAKGPSLGIGVVYDELVRAKWAEKVKHNEPEFSLPRACGRIDRDVASEAEVLWGKLRSEASAGKAAVEVKGAKGSHGSSKSGKTYQNHDKGSGKAGKRPWSWSHDYERQVTVDCFALCFSPSHATCVYFFRKGLHATAAEHARCQAP